MKHAPGDLIEISLVSLGIGIVFAISCTFTLFEQLHVTPILIHLQFLCVYHFLEFLAHALYTSKVSVKLFLIYGNKGNKEFALVQLLAIFEFLFKWSSFYPFEFTPSPFWTCAGSILTIIGLCIRFLAIKTCGKSFNHHIGEVSEQKLVTWGIYRYLRHPSYFGFWIFCIGIQSLLQNYVGLILSVIILTKFFSVRIKYEEQFLIDKMYGEKYIEYKRRVGVCIPFLSI